MDAESPTDRAKGRCTRVRAIAINYAESVQSALERSRDWRGRHTAARVQGRDGPENVKNARRGDFRRAVKSAAADFFSRIGRADEDRRQAGGRAASALGLRVLSDPQAEPNRLLHSVGIGDLEDNAVAANVMIL